MNTEAIDVPGCMGTTVQPLVSDGSIQVLMVEVAPGGVIPLHAHDCAATMVITKGAARTLGKDGRVVTKGDVVVKAAREPHGFSEIKEPFAFLSISDGQGIVSPKGWDMAYL
jgi:quercetin dioxygenase-like cupin family protein